MQSSELSPPFHKYDEVINQAAAFSLFIEYWMVKKEN